MNQRINSPYKPLVFSDGYKEPLNSGYTSVPMNNSPYPNFNPNDPSTFRNIPEYTSFGDAVDLPSSLVNQANRTPETDWMNKLFGKGENFIKGLDVLGTGVGAYLGLQNYNLAKDAFGFNKDLAKTNLSNQARITNAAIEDRSRAGAVQSGASRKDVDRIVRDQTENRRVRGAI